MITKCPVCKSGFMCEHDAGYDECSECDFFAIYYPKKPKDQEEYEQWLVEAAEERARDNIRYKDAT